MLSSDFWRWLVRVGRFGLPEKSCSIGCKTDSGFEIVVSVVLAFPVSLYFFIDLAWFVGFS